MTGSKARGLQELPLSVSKKLLLYGGGSLFRNGRSDRALIGLTGKRKPSITYIPSSSDYGEIEFGEFCENFRKRFPVSRIVYFPIDIPFTDMMKTMALEQDIVYLSGGNTFYFLKTLRQKRLIDDLKSFVSRGGVLSGLSAGAILLTPTVATAGFPHFDRDSNFVKLKNQKSLKLTDFEFFPHYTHTTPYRKALTSHSRKTIYPIYAAPDQSSVVVNGNEIEFIGPVHIFWNGKHYPSNK